MPPAIRRVVDATPRLTAGTAAGNPFTMINGPARQTVAAHINTLFGIAVAVVGGPRGAVRETWWHPSAGVAVMRRVAAARTRHQPVRWCVRADAQKRGLLAVMLLMAAFAAVAQGNLVTNGGFESGIHGWQGTFGVYDQSDRPLEGNAVGVLVDVGHSSVNQTLHQVLPTIPDTRYSIRFWLRLPELYEVAPGVWVPVVGNSLGGSTIIEVRWNGATVGSCAVTQRDQWIPHVVEVLAEGTNSELMFFNPSVAAWPFIDGVTATPVPEPGTGVVTVLGCAGLIWGARRSRSPRPSP